MADDSIEIWKPIRGYENDYEISNMGRVRSIDRLLDLSRKMGATTRFHHGKIKNASPHYKNKYLSVLLKVKGNEKRVFVHRLVADHFIPNPQNKPEVNHKNGDKSDNRAISLEWVTPKENVHHALDLGLYNNSKSVIAIKETALIEFESQRQCAKHFDVGDSWIGVLVRKGKEINGFRLYNI